ncbi:MAG: corrinoid protein [Deltaproteobacteria bacterium]|nr:corrinoid protein [Deltaproteobacteria bacterium]
MVSWETLYTAVIDGDVATARAGTQECIDAGTAAESLLNEGLIAAMKEVGRRFEEGEYFLPEMLVSAKAMKASLALLRPLLTERNVPLMGRVALGSVRGDLHDIGKNLVAMMLQGAGFEVIDLGIDVTPEKFVQAASGAQVIGLSALLTTTMPSMGQVIGALREAGVRDRVKVIVGGAPVTQAFADELGADGFSPDASSAVRKVQELLGLS